MPASDEDLLTMHDEEYVEKIKTAKDLPKEELISMEHGFHDVAFHEV